MSRKRRKSKKNSKSAIIIAVIIIIALFIGVFFLFSGENKSEEEDSFSTTDAAVTTTLYSGAKPQVSTTLPEESTEVTETETITETQSPTKEETTETTMPTAAPVEKVEIDISNVISQVTAYYEDYMSMEKGVLFIDESEAVKRNGKYELVLRSNGQSPNQYVADVYVDIETGKVTDSIGSDGWTIKK